MFKLSGKISDAIRARGLTMKDPEMSPTRRDDAIRDMPEHHYTGRTLNARYRNIGK